MELFPPPRIRTKASARPVDIKIAVPISIKSLNKVRKYSRKTAATITINMVESVGEIPRKSPKATPAKET